MAKQKYRVINWEELVIKNNLPAEQNRVKALFQELLDRVNNGVELTENQKKFFCFCAKLDFIRYNIPENIPICKGEIFKRKYLTYRNGLSEDIQHFKIDEDLARAQIQDYLAGVKPKLEDVQIEIPKNEVRGDLAYLFQIYNTWNSELINPRQNDNLIKKAYKHTKKLLDKENSNSPDYDINRKTLVLNSKYTYLMTKEVFEKVSPTERISSLNGIEIEFDEESFYHINHSHFAPKTKTANSDKSFFTNQDIDYRKLYLEVKGIISRIETSGKYKGEPIRKVSVIYKGETCQLWVNVNRRKDDGKTRFNQVGSFYPITEEDELKDLANNYCLVKIDQELYVYVRSFKTKFKDWFKSLPPIKYIRMLFN